MLQNVPAVTTTDRTARRGIHELIISQAADPVADRQVIVEMKATIPQ